MGKKVSKSTKKFAASGQLKKTIQARRKYRDIKKKTEKRKAGKGKQKDLSEAEEDDDDMQGQEIDGEESGR